MVLSIRRLKMITAKFTHRHDVNVGEELPDDIGSLHGPGHGGVGEGGVGKVQLGQALPGPSGLWMEHPNLV